MATDEKSPEIYGASEISKSPKIYKAITKVMQEVGAIGKDSKNTQQNYKYRGIDAVYNGLNSVMAQNGIFTVCMDIIDEKISERASRSGGVLFEYSATFIYRFYADDGSFVDHKSKGKGMDSGDKDTNKAMSVAHKYALLQVFAIPTDDEKDPEIDSHEVIDTVKKPVPTTKEGWAKSQQNTDNQIAIFEATKKKVNALSTLAEYEKARADWEVYKKGPKMVLNNIQAQMVENLFNIKLTNLQEDQLVAVDEDEGDTPDGVLKDEEIAEMDEAIK